MAKGRGEPGLAEVIFPLRGVDVSVPFDRQPANTCVVGVNVRVDDPFRQRDRGGSRPGLARWIDQRPEGDTPVQMLGTVVYYSAAALLSVTEQDPNIPPADSSNPMVIDDSTNNFSDGPPPTGPGGNPQGGPTGQPGFNARLPTGPNGKRKRPQKGSGVQPNRGVTPATVPPPPPPPTTRTYTPFADFHSGEFVGVFSIGPVTLPLTPPTNLFALTAAVDYFGDSWQAGTLSAWAGTALPTVADVNGFYSSFGHGPYETSSDA